MGNSKNGVSLDFKTLGQIIGLISSILVGGMAMGALSSRVTALEARKDPAEDVASMKSQIEGLRSDVNDMRQDIKSLLRRK